MGTGEPVGVIGLGMLGRDLVAAAIDRGASVVAYDVTPAAFDTLTAEVRRARDIAEVASVCTVISVVVRTDEQVDDVVSGPGGLRESARAGSVVLLHSTVSLETVRQTAATLQSVGVDTLDAPVCRFAGEGSPTTALVGGHADVVARAQQALDALVDDHVHLGELGTGMTAKAIRNAVVYAAYAAVADAIDIAQGSGIPGDVIGEVLRRTGVTAPSGNEFASLRLEWLDGRHSDTSDRVGYTDLAHKDIDIALGIASAAGIDAPFTVAVRDAMARAYLAAAD